MRYYLAGKMTGLPNFGYDVFEEACKDLRSIGLEISSPHEKEHHESVVARGKRPYAYYLAHGLMLLMKCDAIILMRNWSDSHGAKIELNAALDLNKSVFYYVPKYPEKILEIS